MKFDIEHIAINRTNKSGFNYEITGYVNGQSVIAFTNDSEAFDWLKDESEPELNKQAILHCETKLMEAFIDGNY